MNVLEQEMKTEMYILCIDLYFCKHPQLYQWTEPSSWTRTLFVSLIFVTTVPGKTLCVQSVFVKVNWMDSRNFGFSYHL